MSKKVELINAYNKAGKVGVNVITSEDYKGKSYGEVKANFIQSLNTTIWTRYVFDMLNEVNDIVSNFLVEPVNYGLGWARLTLGLAKPEAFTSDPKNRFLETKNYLSDYAETFQDITQDYIRITMNEIDMRDAFKGQDELSRYFTLMNTRISQSFNLRNLDFIRFLFGATNTPFLPVDSELYKIATRYKTQMTNVINYEVDATKQKETEQMVKMVISVVEKMMVNPSDAWHLNKDITGYPCSVNSSDLILVYSILDKINFNTESRVGFYNSELFNWPDIKKIALDIPAGTCYIIHKDSLQIAPYYKGTYTTFYPTTLDTDVITHLQFRVGLSQIAPFVKITKK